MASISNQAHVSFSYNGSTTTRNNSSNVVNSTIRDRYSLSVEKSATSETFVPGDTFTYFVEVTNNGCGCLNNFHINDNLGSENYLNYIEGSARLFINGSMTEINPTSTNPLEFDVISRLNRDESFVILFNVLLDETLTSEVTEITNTVEVTASPCGCDCQTDDQSISDSASHTITRRDFAEVLITKTASSDNFCCDEEIDYYITLTNIGNIDATNVIVTDSLPESFTATEIHMENNGNHYQFDPSEYTIDDANFLTLPNETGTAILVPSIGPGVDNNTTIRIHGHM